MCADDDCRRAGGTRAARKGANTRRPSVSDAETGPNAHLEDYSAVSGDERRGRSRDKRVASRERGKRRSATSNEGANGALVLLRVRFFCSRSRRIFKNRSVSTGRTDNSPSQIFFPQHVRSWTLERSGRHNSFFYSESEKEWFCLYFLRMGIQLRPV